MNRFTAAPQLVVFNVSNSDAMISTVTNETLSTSCRYANSIMQPRMVGVGAQVGRRLKGRKARTPQGRKVR